jgi:hypothetical protein
MVWVQVARVKRCVVQEVEVKMVWVHGVKVKDGEGTGG